MLKKESKKKEFYITQVKKLFYHNYSFIGIFYFVIKAGDTSHTEEIWGSW